MTGHLTTRFGSVAMDEGRLMTAARTAALNTVRVRLIEQRKTGAGRAAPHHLVGRYDDLVSGAPLLDRCAGRFADPDLNRDGAVG